ncbi:MAG TPA: hypothetical protein VFY92_08790 [Hyphomicrobiaceae bacterium]|nr:hypothetical protein [Hyphomicrobiaceae bacterium]
MIALLISMAVAVAVLAPQIYAVKVWRGAWRWLAAARLLLLAGDPTFTID